MAVAGTLSLPPLANPRNRPTKNGPPLGVSRKKLCCVSWSRPVPVRSKTNEPLPPTGMPSLGLPPPSKTLLTLPPTPTPTS